jgi:RNA polymerase sigma-70 factor (ECF subfamily)
MTDLDLTEAFRRHRRELTAAAMRVLRSPDELDDVMQDAFLQAVRAVRGLRHPGALRAWLTTVTVRAALRRRSRPAFIGFDDAPGCDQVAHQGISPADHALLAAVESIVCAIPAERRRPWTLRYLEGEQIESIAARCGCSRATAKRRIAEVQAAVEAATADAAATGVAA